MTTRILVLCTGNSCRSIMAEALFNHLGAGKVTAVSAGSQPAGHVHPLSLDTLARHGIPCPHPASKSWDAFEGQDFDLVVTVCDSAAAEACPAFIGRARKLHWSTPDPARAEGTPEEIAAAFDRAFLMLKEKIEDYLK